MFIEKEPGESLGLEENWNSTYSFKSIIPSFHHPIVIFASFLPVIPTKDCLSHPSASNHNPQARVKNLVPGQSAMLKCSHFYLYEDSIESSLQ